MFALCSISCVAGAVKLYIISDTHIEFGDFTPPRVDADAVLLAGDIGVGTSGVDWAARTFPDTPVLYIAGNHEYYGYTLPGLVDKLRRRAEGTSVRVLENDVAVLDGIAFCGCTLWTDFNLFGNAYQSGWAAKERMNDYRKIRVPPQYRRLRPHDTMTEHTHSLSWLRTELEQRSAQKTVVMTHHAPSLFSVVPSFRENELSAAYASHLDDVVASSGAVLWVHGHTHYAVDYTLGSTRVFSNPRGYVDDPVPGFQGGLVVEV